MSELRKTVLHGRHVALAILYRPAVESLLGAKPEEHRLLSGPLAAD